MSAAPEGRQSADIVRCRICGDTWPRAGLWKQMLPDLNEVAACDVCIWKQAFWVDMRAEQSDGSDDA